LATRPLRGLPIGVKDIYDTADLPTRYGSAIYAGHRPKADAAMVALIRRAGGAVIGKTVTTEFASLQPAGTRNPHNLAHTPGGSSSGSAAAVAAGMVPIALGSQTGGSVIRPAAFCGVVGFKPSFRLMPTIGMKCFSWSLDTVGLFAASVADAAFAAALISGRDLRIDSTEPAAPRIALVRTQSWPEASASMQDAIARAAHAAEAAGAKVTEVELPPIFETATQAHGTIQDHEACQALADEIDRHRDQLGPILREQLDKAAAITPAAYDDARRLARQARRAFVDFMEGIDVLLTPSAPGAAPLGLNSTGKPTFNRLWTLLGTPCVNVPGLFDSAGLPLGVQIVGRFARDRLALEAAEFLQRALATP
jgi:Asp-tRNA(Asn)/Glu-tRNA(Gln) amidotransferase A subunit family amidase